MSPDSVTHALSVVGVLWMAAQLVANGRCVEVRDSKINIKIGSYDMEITLTRRR
jgi:hypothetical protein